MSKKPHTLKELSARLAKDVQTELSARLSPTTSERWAEDIVTSALANIINERLGAEIGTPNWPSMSLRDRIASKVSKRVNHSEDLRALIDANVKEALSDMHPAVETLVREHVERLLQYVVNERVERVLGSMVEEIIHQARPTVVKDAMAMLGIVDQPVVDTPNETSTP